MRRGRVLLLFMIAVVVLVADAVSKAVVVADLSGHRPIRLLGGALTLTLTRNPGAAFGIGAGATVLFTLIAVAVVVVIMRTARRLSSLGWAVVLGLLLGGAAGNLADRLFRSPGPLRGHVVDWIQLPHWPVFNLADAAITVGAVAAVLLAARGHRLGEATPSGSGTDVPTAPAAAPAEASGPPPDAVPGSRRVPGGLPAVTAPGQPPGQNSTPPTHDPG